MKKNILTKTFLLVLLFLSNISLSFSETNKNSKLYAENDKKKLKFFQMATGGDPTDDKSNWEKKFQKDEYVYGKEPAAFLVESLKLLPSPGKGKVLDIAMSEGRNAVFLSKLGYNVDGVDFAEEALKKAAKLAKENNTKINIINADLNSYKIKKNEYDVIIVFYFLLRKQIQDIKQGLKPGGIVIFENYTVEQLKKKNSHMLEKEFLFESNELLKAFSDFKIIKYSEVNNGKEAIASLVAQKHQK